MRGQHHRDVSTWVHRHADRMAPGSDILDLACGNGRHTRYLTNLGHRVTALDIDLYRVNDLVDDDRIELVAHDLENSPWPFPDRRFGGIIITNYLHRPLYPHIFAALDDGAILIYDTFAAGNERFGHPRNPAFLLYPGELLDAFAADLRIVAYDHGRVDEPRPAIRQRLCAIRTSTSQSI